jgi:flagellar motor switch protein FliN/FliY
MAGNPSLAETWAAGIADSLLAMTGEKPVCECKTADAVEAGATWQQYDFNLSGAAHLWVAATEAAWKAIGERVLKSTGLEDAELSDIRDTYAEIVSQSNGAVASRLTATTGSEVSCRAAAQPEEEPRWSALAKIELVFPGDTPLVLYLGFSEPMLAALQPAPPPPPLARDDANGPSQESAVLSMASKTLDVFLDVEVPVCVSFGSTFLAIQDVLKLNSGSIIELNRSISQPVDLIVNNCVIARAEVVVVEGNYGVRIKEIASPGERLRTTRETVVARAAAAGSQS